MHPLKVNFTTRSAIVDREECDRLRLIKWELDETGYEPISASVAALSGIHIHNGFAGLLTGKTVEEAVAEVRASYAKEAIERGLAQAVGEDLPRVVLEQQTMLEGMVRGWAEVRMPHLLDEYEVMSVEREWLWELAPDMKIPLRLDAILRRKSDGLLHILDFKGTATGDSTWQETHERSRQTVLYLTALEERSGEPVGGMIYEGLIRGQFKMDTAKGSPFYQTRIQHTPYAYGYAWSSADKSEPVKYRHDYTNAKGWSKIRTWEAMPPKEWLDSQLRPAGVLQGLFVGGDPISPPPAERQMMRREIAHEERTWFEGLDQFKELVATEGLDSPMVQSHLEKFAPHKTGRCTKYGMDNRCPYYQDGICFLADSLRVIAEDRENFKPRDPHHRLEEAA